MSDIALQYIKERLPLSPVVRKTSAGDQVILLQIPNSSEPRAVEFDGRTEYWKRFGSGKRQMTHAEITTAFAATRNLEKELELDRSLLADRNRWSEIRTPGVLWEAMDKQFHIHPWVQPQQNKWLRLTVTPRDLRENCVDTSDAQLQEMLRNPPGQYPLPFSWNISLGDHAEIETSGLGLVCKVTKPRIILRLISLTRSGHLEFWTQFQEMFELKRCSYQGDQRPRSYLVLEPAAPPTYAVGFLRFANALYHHLNVGCDFIFRTEFRNLMGCALAPGAWKPGLGAECFRVFSEPHFGPVETRLEQDINPEINALTPIVRLYRAFGYERQNVPFFPNDAFDRAATG